MPDTYQPTADEALAEIRANATSFNSAMPPEGFAAALRDWIAHHDAELLELVAGTMPPVSRGDGYQDFLSREDLINEAQRRRVGLS